MFMQLGAGFNHITHSLSLFILCVRWSCISSLTVPIQGHAFPTVNLLLQPGMKQSLRDEETKFCLHVSWRCDNIAVIQEAGVCSHLLRLQSHLNLADTGEQPTHHTDPTDVLLEAGKRFSGRNCQNLIKLLFYFQCWLNSQLAETVA